MNFKSGFNNIISPSVIIHDNVVIGNNNFIGDNVIIYPNTIIGNNNKIFNGNIIGEFPIHTSLSDYDLSICKGVIIGDNNILHIKNLLFSGFENPTIIGNNNKILAEVHIGHDTIIKDNVCIYPRVIIGGYSILLDNCNIGMGTVIHQKRTIGQYSMTGANNMVSKHVFPYYININNKITRLNKIKIPIEIIEFDKIDEILKEIYNNFINKNFDILKYHLSDEIKNVLSIFFENTNKF